MSLRGWFTSFLQHIGGSQFVCHSIKTVTALLCCCFFIDLNRIKISTCFFTPSDTLLPSCKTIYHVCIHFSSYPLTSKHNWSLSYTTPLQDHKITNISQHRPLSKIWELWPVTKLKRYTHARKIHFTKNAIKHNFKNYRTFYRVIDVCF